MITEHLPGGHLPSFSPKKIRKKRKKIVSFHKNVNIKERTEISVKNLETNLVTGFAYSVVDGFSNGIFNMVFVTKRSEEEVRLRDVLIINTDKVTKNKYDMTKS